MGQGADVRNLSEETFAMSELWCPTHGKVDAAAMFAGTSFCDQCIRDALLKLGVQPVTVQVVKRFPIVPVGGGGIIG
jgi:hypothetical protein